jgi:ketosteroid isomerase-like protein
MSHSTAQSVLTTFLDAFSRVDLDGLLDCFDLEATAFLPAEHGRMRLEGKGPIGAAFAAVIARVRATGQTSLPLDVEDLLVQEWDDTAVATFHLRAGHLGRRTVVLRRQVARWRIVHLHASNAPLEE